MSNVNSKQALQTFDGKTLGRVGLGLPQSRLPRIFQIKMADDGRVEKDEVTFSVGAVLPAAGSGTRMRMETPKQVIKETIELVFHFLS